MNHLNVESKTANLKSLRDIAAETIRDAIISGYLKPGEHLKERQLAEQMGFSTTPIKEALRLLNHEGLVVTLPRKGSYVSEIVNSTIEEVLTLKASLESLCAKFCALKITDEEIQEIEEQIQLMERLTKNRKVKEVTKENEKFHQMIRETSRNTMVSQMLNSVVMFDQAFRRRALKHTIELEVGFNEHKMIFEAIKERNPFLAEERMKKHIERTVENVLRILKD